MKENIKVVLTTGQTVSVDDITGMSLKEGHIFFISKNNAGQREDWGFPMRNVAFSIVTEVSVH